ncbi:MAG: hypothetical protein EXX96DRAFT_612124 [Benjaminiella poitrasii]|nr:MAG: hypothetical protein EXX96DRAFT_612124 [Benjaminiella poitrasii]
MLGDSRYKIILGQELDLREVLSERGIHLISREEASRRTNVLWGIENLGPLPLASKEKVTWAVVIEGKAYLALSITHRRKGQLLEYPKYIRDTRRFCSDLFSGTKWEWMLEFPEECYRYLDLVSIREIRACQIYMQDFLKWFEHDTPYSNSILHRISMPNYLDHSSGTLSEWIIREWIKKNKDEKRFPLLTKLNSVQALLNRAYPLIEAIENKDIAYLRDSFPIPDKKGRYFHLYFLIMIAYGYDNRCGEYINEIQRRSLQRVVSVFTEPEWLLNRILHDISAKDEGEENHTKSEYFFDKLGYDLYNRKDDIIFFDEWYEGIEGIEEYYPNMNTVHSRAIYEYYRLDSNFHMTDVTDIIGLTRSSHDEKNQDVIK